MKKPKKSTLIAIGVAVGVFLLYFLMVGVMGLPFYTALIVYLLIILVVAFVNRYSLIAIRGNLAYMRGDAEKAGRVLKYAVDHNTVSPAAHLNYGVILMRGGDAENALRCLIRAQELNKNILNGKSILASMGTCYWLAGDIGKAIETLEGMREKYEYVNGNVLTTLGYMYLLDGDSDKAEEITWQAINDMPELAAAWDNLGQIYYRRGEYAEAREHFEKAVGFKPGLPDSLYFLGRISGGEGKRSEARDFLERALACKITALNTICRAEIEECLAQYKDKD